MRLFIVINILIIAINCQAEQIYNRKLQLMGCNFGITVVANDSLRANHYIDTAIYEIQRIEKLISSWDKNSETSKINKNAGIKAVSVSQELIDLIQRALVISKLTDGAFDISYASMDKIWKFDGSMKQMPSEEVIKKSVAKVGYQNIILNLENNTVFLKQKGMKIGFGAIGKGYAADKAKKLLQNLGVKAGIINASGDMCTWGKQPSNEDWKIAITNPMKKENSFALLSISDKAIVTSGNYEKYITFNNIRYSHIINPETGLPATGIISVSVVAQSAELADALATSVFIMGKDVGIDRINQIPNTECIIVDEKGKVFTSKNININEK